MINFVQKNKFDLKNLNPTHSNLSVSNSNIKSNEFIIKVEHLSKKFGDFYAVDDISFEVKRGEIFGFLGADDDKRFHSARKRTRQYGGAAYIAFKSRSCHHFKASAVFFLSFGILTLTLIVCVLVLDLAIAGSLFALIFFLLALYIFSFKYRFDGVEFSQNASSGNARVRYAFYDACDDV